MTAAHVLAVGLVAVLWWVAGLVRSNRRLRAELSAARIETAAFRELWKRAKAAKHPPRRGRW